MNSGTASPIPYRLDLAGSWHDQPFLSRHADGSVITVPLMPDREYDARSGLASSTRDNAIELWPGGIPAGDRVQLGRILFRYDNPPGTKDISGSQDALGIVLPGVNRLHYSRGEYWPVQIEGIDDESVVDWLESVVHLVPLGPRVPGYSVLDGVCPDSDKAAAMAAAVGRCWEAIRRCDAPAFGEAMTSSFDALVSMMPRVMNDEVATAIDRIREQVLGYKLAGAGGGGYLVVVSERSVDGGMGIQIVRK